MDSLHDLTPNRTLTDIDFTTPHQQTHYDILHRRHRDESPTDTSV